MNRLLTEREVAEFAASIGDWNPLHHNREYAARSRYGGIIASGPQTTALLMGLVATHFSQLGPMVGLDFSFQFYAGTPANVTLAFDWLVIRSEPTSSKKGDIVELRGRVKTPTGKTVVGAKGRILVSRTKSH